MVARCWWQQDGVVELADKDEAEITRLREALDDLAMGAPRRGAFEALRDEHRYDVLGQPRASI